MYKRTYILIIALVLTGFMTSIVWAQDNGDKFRDKIEKIKLEKLVKKLELDDNTAEKFKAKYKDFSAEVRDLNQKRVEAYKQMLEDLKNGSPVDSSLNKVLDYENQLYKARESFAEDLKTILTPKQIAIMIVFERKFNTELKKILKDYIQDKKQNNDD